MLKHLLSSALLTLALTGASLAHCGDCSGGTSSHGDQATIVTVASQAGKFETLLTAAQAAGLLDTLNGEGPLTIFAPTDEAFAKLPAGTVEALLADKDKLKEVLLYHVVPGNLKAADVVTRGSLQSAQGSSIILTVDNGKVLVNGAQVVSTDIEASNGTIHIIDAVILPPAESAAK